MGNALSSFKNSELLFCELWLHAQLIYFQSVQLLPIPPTPACFSFLCTSQSCKGLRHQKTIIFFGVLSSSLIDLHRLTFAPDLYRVPPISQFFPPHPDCKTCQVQWLLAQVHGALSTSPLYSQVQGKHTGARENSGVHFRHTCVAKSPRHLYSFPTLLVQEHLDTWGGWRAQAEDPTLNCPNYLVFQYHSFLEAIRNKVLSIWFRHFLCLRLERLYLVQFSLDS